MFRIALLGIQLKLVLKLVAPGANYRVRLAGAGAACKPGRSMLVGTTGDKEIRLSPSQMFRARRASLGIHSGGKPMSAIRHRPVGL